MATCDTPLEVLQCAHVVSRRYLATRWDPSNAVALCRRHHMQFTQDPLGWDDWVSERIGQEAYEKLKRRAREVTKVDYNQVLASLQSQEEDA